MRLDKDTIKKTEQLKNEATAKVQQQRSGLLRHVAIDAKFALVIDPQYRDEAKRVMETIHAASADLEKYDEIIMLLNKAAAELGVDVGRLAERHQHFESKIVSNETMLREGILKNLLSREKVAELESTVVGLKTKQKESDDIINPVAAKVSALPEVKLNVPARPSNTEGF